MTQVPLVVVLLLLQVELLLPGVRAHAPPWRHATHGPAPTYGLPWWQCALYPPN